MQTRYLEGEVRCLKVTDAERAVVIVTAPRALLQVHRADAGPTLRISSRGTCPLAVVQSTRRERPSRRHTCAVNRPPHDDTVDAQLKPQSASAVR
jgi:hypothetical protein